MSIIEESSWEGQRLIITWHDAGFAPPREQVTQVSGLCFTDAGQVVLVSTDGTSWQLVGGHPENSETLEATLAREANEEACARVVYAVYLGSQEVDTFEDSTGPPTYYQARFWARVLLDEFDDEHETIARKLVEPTEIKEILNWHTTRILDAVLHAALEQERRFKVKKIG